MARASSGRFVLTGSLQFHEPFLIGGIDVEAGLDSSPMFNGLGKVLVPGTSLAGVLRSWLTHHLNDVDSSDLENIFGGQDLSNGASRIRFDDIALEGVELTTVDGVGIDRHTGAAAHGVKFDQTLVTGNPSGSVRIVCDVPSSDDPLDSSAHTVMQAIGEVLQQPLLRLGRGTTKGFGLFSLKDVSLVVQRANAEGVMHRLAGTGERIELRSSTGLSLKGKTSLRIEFESVGSVFTKASIAGTIVDVIPRVEPRNGKAALILPATSIRGVLRSESERIVRTLLGASVDPLLPHHQQTDVPLVNEMYGASPQTGDGALGDDEVVSTSTIGKANLTITSAYSDLCAWPDWEEVLRVALQKKSNSESDRANAEESLSKATQSVPLQFTHHVALDRWTGAAADKMLYTVLEPTGGGWSGLTIEIDHTRLGQNKFAALALLIHTLQSLHSGAIGFGWGTTKGHGTVRLKKVSIRSEESTIELTQLSDWLWDDVRRANQDLFDEIKSSWTTWLNSARGANR
jgi:CRISPR/Cas system CSM-associated protein Csm3 (group 7 of RAMP superfamily)